MSMRVYAIAVFICIQLQGYGFSQNVRIGISPTKKFNHICFNKPTTEYLVIADSSFIGILDASCTCEIYTAATGKLGVQFKGERFSGYTAVRIIATHYNHSIELSSSSPVMRSRAYEGDFEMINEGNKILVINDVPMEKYLAGVLESEAGEGRKEEYYKVQAVISRTFALRSIDKHIKQGFNLCNQEHCQAYFHKRKGSPIIDSAVLATRNQVLYDTKSKFAPTFFSANCGGETCNPVHVWNNEIPGLVSLVDTFCTKTKQSKWSCTIDPTEWKAFFVKNYAFPIDDSLSYNLLFSASSEHRNAFFIHPGYGIPMRDIREKFNLKSSFFSVKLENNRVILTGKGFGHGVGLCQEGAIEMAQLGYNYKQILGFYFPNFILGVSGNLSHLGQ